MKKTTKSKYKINTKVISKEIDEQIFILDANEGKLRSLNPVASLIWIQLKKPKSLAQLVDKILEEFDVEEKTAHRDAQEFLRKYLKKGLIKKLNYQ